jgi:hypothetical protein
MIYWPSCYCCCLCQLLATIVVVDVVAVLHETDAMPTDGTAVAAVVAEGDDDETESWMIHTSSRWQFPMADRMQQLLQTRTRKKKIMMTILA